MKLITVFLAWIISVIMGSLLCSAIFVQDNYTDYWPTVLMFIVFSGLFSLPYICIMLLAVELTRLKFYQYQLIHLTITVLMYCVGLFINDRDLMEHGALLLLIYFVFGVLAQFVLTRLFGERSTNPKEPINENLKEL